MSKRYAGLAYHTKNSRMNSDQASEASPGSTETRPLPIELDSHLGASPPAPLVSLELRDALMACHQGSPTQLLLPTWKTKAESFIPPYRLYLAMIAGGDHAVRHVLSDDYFMQCRERAPSGKNLALVAITVFVKPAPEDQSACSDYACVLEHARDHDVLPEQLTTWLLATTLSACKAEVRAKRALKKRTLEAHAETDATLAGVSRHQAALMTVIQMPPASLKEGENTEVSDDFALNVRVRTAGNSSEYLIAFVGGRDSVHLIAPMSNASPLPVVLRRLADRFERSSWSCLGDDDA